MDVTGSGGGCERKGEGLDLLSMGLGDPAWPVVNVRNAGPLAKYPSLSREIHSLKFHVNSLNI